ncbi:magnesium ion transporter [Apophysomyces ossiformis]|uniref:Magnesium transporter n=1 Tax=Apophysomyces ossiformis TaxID=679940 RepID=A0A8H7BRS0_9FUNG|nr:magnesium ion transporter [Apophysomyces ossiformis]
MKHIPCASRTWRPAPPPVRRFTTRSPPPQRVLSLPTKVAELKLRCTEFDHNGHVKTTAGEFLKSDFCQQHSLLPRDLRTIDTNSFYEKPTILVRSEAILVNMAHMKALLKSDLVVLFDTFGSTDSYNQSIFIYDLQERLGSQKDGLPFEFRALEAILISVTSSLQTELEVLEGPVYKLLNDLEDLADIEESMNGDRLRDLLQYSKKLAKFEQDALSIRDAIDEILDHDEDLAAMYLTAKKAGKPRAPSDHEEIELLLEAYYKQTEEIAAKASTLRTHMRSTEEIIQIILDVSRNSLMWYDIRLTIITLSASIVSGFGAIFGMNLKNYFENDPYAFGLVSGLALASGMGAFAVSLRKLKTLAKFKR